MRNRNYVKEIRDAVHKNASAKTLMNIIMDIYEDGLKDRRLFFEQEKGTDDIQIKKG